MDSWLRHIAIIGAKSVDVKETDYSCLTIEDSTLISIDCVTFSDGGYGRYL
ncbi:hypothetical protein [Muribaculum intestinale]|uniref:hypothetical protein n=1 Tax=Muribaculum intestinale TaxID=1796646 RepID=UPI002637D97A|nr:hypothetical protein [Muribaculum intestinale]